MAEPTPTDTTTLSAVPSAVASAAASAVGTPQSLPLMDADEREKSIKVSLADLTAKAGALYAQKKYEEAAEIFAQAAEMQAEFNGEMSPENADILFLYGRSLFKVGQSKSDVLGGRAAGEEKKTKKPQASNGAAKSTKPTAEPSVAPLADIKEEEQKTAATKRAAEGAAIVAKTASRSGAKEGAEADAKKPLFQFTGDENFEDSDDDEAAEGDGEDEGEEEEEDDLAVAFEVLDLARILFEKTLEQGEAEPADAKGKDAADPNSLTVRHVKERLADTHDLLAEISLENEKYARPGSRHLRPTANMTQVPSRSQRRASVSSIQAGSIPSGVGGHCRGSLQALACSRVRLHHYGSRRGQRRASGARRGNAQRGHLRA